MKQNKPAVNQNEAKESPTSDFQKSLEDITFRWNPEILSDIVALPGRVVDSELKFASGDQVKVLLWLCRHIGEVFSSENCARDIGIKAGLCLDALDYWVSRAIILPTADVMPTLSRYPAVTETKMESASSAKGKAVVKSVNSAESIIQNVELLKNNTNGKSLIRPTTKDVLKKQKNNGEFAFLLNEASARLGKPINHGDMESLLYLFDTIGQPAAVILLIIAYAVSAGKGSMRYIEKVAINWSEQGIDTIEAAERHLCELERKTTSWSRVCEILKIDKKATGAEMNAAERWIYDWQFEPDVIKVAYEVCMAKIEKFRASYMDKILSGWHLDGVDTVEKALEQLDPKKSSASVFDGGVKAKANKGKKSSSDKQISFDFDEYENMVASFVPVYKKDNKNGEG